MKLLPSSVRRRPDIDLDFETGAGRQGQQDFERELVDLPTQQVIETRLMPSLRAARACVVFKPRTFLVIAIMTLDRIVIVAACSGLSSGRPTHW